jgi:WD40 repeat protein/tetratricopeptide (TPR) repeat protein
VYDARSAPEALALKAPAQLWRPVFSPDGKQVAAALGLRTDGVLRVYDVRSGQEVLALRGPAALTGPAFSPDGARIATRSPDGIARLFDVRTGRELLRFTGPAPLATPVFSPDGSRVAVTPGSIGGDGVVRVFDAQTGEEALALKGPAPLGLAAFSPDGACLAVAPAPAGGDGVVRLYDAWTGQELRSLKGPKPLSVPVFSPDGARVAVAPAEKGGDGVVRVYGAKTGKELMALKGPKALGLPVFSPDGSRLAVPPASTGGDGVVRLFDARTGKEILTFRGPAALASPILGAEGVSDLPAFSPDGSRIAIPPAMVGGDGAVRLFDTGTGQEVLAVRGMTSLSSPTFSRDGTRLAAGPWSFRGDGGLQVWTAPHDPAAWQEERRQAVGAGLRQWHHAQALEYFTVRQWFAAAFHFGRLLDTGPAGGAVHFLYGTSLAHLGRTAEANRELERALERKQDVPLLVQAEAHAMLAHWEDAATLFARGAGAPNTAPAVWYRHALLRLKLEDRAGYGNVCAVMVPRFGRTTNTAVANQVAWACAVGPGALGDLEPAVRLAENAVRANSGSFETHTVLGAILYRAGRLKDAVAALNEAVKLNDQGGTANGFLFLAMAQQRLGLRGDANASLERARQLHARQPPALWVERLEWQLLSREAEETLKAGS